MCTSEQEHDRGGECHNECHSLEEHGVGASVCEQQQESKQQRPLVWVGLGWVGFITLSYRSIS